MINNELLNFIKEQTAKGGNKEKITEMLTGKGGWLAEDVAEAYEALNLYSSTYQSALKNAQAPVASGSQTENAPTEIGAKDNIPGQNSLSVGSTVSGAAHRSTLPGAGMATTKDTHPDIHTTLSTSALPTTESKSLGGGVATSLAQKTTTPVGFGTASTGGALLGVKKMENPTAKPSMSASGPGAISPDTRSQMLSSSPAPSLSSSPEPFGTKTAEQNMRANPAEPLGQSHNSMRASQAVHTPFGASTAPHGMAPAAVAVPPPTNQPGSHNAGTAPGMPGQSFAPNPGVSRANLTGSIQSPALQNFANKAQQGQVQKIKSARRGKGIIYTLIILFVLTTLSGGIIFAYAAGFIEKGTLPALDSIMSKIDAVIPLGISDEDSENNENDEALNPPLPEGELDEPFSSGIPFDTQINDVMVAGDESGRNTSYLSNELSLVFPSADPENTFMSGAAIASEQNGILMHCDFNLSECTIALPTASMQELDSVITFLEADSRIIIVKKVPTQ